MGTYKQRNNTAVKKENTIDSELLPRNGRFEKTNKAFSDSFGIFGACCHLKRNLVLIPGKIRKAENTRYCYSKNFG